MEKFRLKAPHFFNGHYLEAGEIVECDPEKASRQMEPLNPKPKADPVTAEQVAAIVEAIKAEPKEGELTDKGNPTKAAVEARLGQTVPQPLFLSALKQ